MLCLGLALTCATWAKDYVAKSPDGRLAVTIHAGTGTTSFQVSHAGHLLLNSSQVGMNLADGRYIGSHAVVGTHTRKVRETIPVVAGKNTTRPPASPAAVCGFSVALCAARVRFLKQFLKHTPWFFADLFARFRFSFFICTFLI